MPDSEPEPRLTIEIVPRSALWRDAGTLDAAIKDAARAAYGAAAPAYSKHEVAIVLSDDAEQRRLNAAYRGKDESTNVLSFPAADALDASPHAALGDVVLAFETVMREAEEDGKDETAHVAHLVMHGVLHLLGHGHEDDGEAEAMEQMETRLMTALGYADPHALCAETPS